METRRFLLGLSITTSLVFAAFLSTTPATADDDSTRKPKDDGYRGIWFALGQFSDAPYGKGSWKSFWEYGDKNTGGNGTYTAKHVPIAIYAPEAKKTFFCYGGSKEGKRYLYNMISYYDHQTDRVPRPTIIHDKKGVDDPHDNSTLTIDAGGHIWE